MADTKHQKVETVRGSFLCGKKRESGSNRNNCNSFVSSLNSVLKEILFCRRGEEKKKKMATTVIGTVVLQRKNVLDLNDFHASLHDAIREFLGKRVSLQLVSAVHTDSGNGLAPKIGAPAYLEDWPAVPDANPVGDSVFKVKFNWNQEIGTPGALLIKNHHKGEFFLKTVTLEDVPGTGKIHFVCNSWVYNVEKYKYDRVFFANQSYLPSETPAPLKMLREAELEHLRGDGKGQLQEWDRVYDYAFYNDLGEPDKGEDYVRPVLGGSTEYPYPRRGRTGRPSSKSDPKTESRLPQLFSLDIYVPRDERFGHLKMSDFLAYALKSVVQVLIPEFEALFDKTIDEFDSFQDILDMYEDGIKLPQTPAIDAIKQKIPLELLKELVRTDGERLLKFPTPQVIQNDESAWRTDEEFAREMLAGVNPVMIRRLEEFPPKSTLDPAVYGPQDSTITAEHIEKFLHGLPIQEAIEKNRLFILEHHDAFIPYLNRINASTGNKIYASRTLLFLKDDGTLTPLAIELSLPNPNDHGSVSKVYTPADEGVEASLWQLAKAYVAVDDSGYHQLISHWLNTHCVIEPFVIATNRQLSSMHPMYKLLHPHFRDTMNINALARQILISAGGILEKTVFPGKFAMEMSSVVYKGWAFTEQALPADLLKR